MVEREEPSLLCLLECPFFVGMVVERDDESHSQVFCRAGCSKQGSNPFAVRAAVLLGATCEARIGIPALEVA